MKKPIIGMVPLWDEKKDSLWMLPGYPTGIERAGGIPVMLPLTGDLQVVRQLTEVVDGVLFTGGHDLSPALYGQERLDTCGPVCVQRDEMEQMLFSEMLCRNKPAFGICRGIQLFNVLLGGDLYQDIPSQLQSELCHKQKPPYDHPAHKVLILSGTPLHSLIGQETLDVNSYHHQGLRTLASGLAVMAQSPDGLAEAVYMPGYNFVWAVQWHPEFTLENAASQALLAAFIRACGV